MAVPAAVWVVSVHPEITPSSNFHQLRDTTEEILGNVLSGSAPPKPSASIRYTIGKGAERIWPADQNSVENLSRVSVFDSHSAGVYLRERTDVAFRPFGLDLFDGLSVACEQVQGRLTRDRSALGSGNTLPEVPEETAVHGLLANLSSLTKPERVTELAAFSTEDQDQLAFLSKKVADLEANDPTKLARTLELKAQRVSFLRTHLEKVDSTHSDEFMAKIRTARGNRDEMKKVAQDTRSAALSGDLLPGTGLGVWNGMWEAARHFSEASAYESHEFPFTGEGARCVLCQQDLDAAAAERLSQFEEFGVSDAEKQYREAEKAFSELRDDLTDLEVFGQQIRDLVAEVEVENGALAADVEDSLRNAELRRNAILDGLEKLGAPEPDLPGFSSASARIAILEKQIRERASEISKEQASGAHEKIQTELTELFARKMLHENLTIVLDEIERKKKIAAFGLCEQETRTNSVTRKSTEVTREVVTTTLRKSFLRELGDLNFHHVEVELQEAGGERGALYHKLVLKRAPGVEVPKVVSEGEARCLSIAAFFAELSTADDPSAILFDDPVSSLDHKWRTSVAKRLVHEARHRQVVVFTHDIVFLLALQNFAENAGVEVLNRHLRRERIGAGISEEALPWPAMKVKTRIGVLKNKWQQADKKSRDGDTISYEHDAVVIYGLMRETWERALEEVLLGGVVERFRESVQTQQIGTIADITDEDCKALEAGMAKCSKWLPGHDQAAAVNEPIPGPSELNSDIVALEAWVKNIRDRR